MNDTAKALRILASWLETSSVFGAAAETVRNAAKELERDAEQIRILRRRVKYLDQDRQRLRRKLSPPPPPPPE